MTQQRWLVLLLMTDSLILSRNNSITSLKIKIFDIPSATTK